MSGTATAYYLYCLTPEGAPALDGPGFDGRFPAFPLQLDGVTAIVSEVPVEEFLGEAAAARLADIAWVGPRAAGHDSVIAEAMGQASVLPAPFATLFSSESRLEEWFGRHRETILDFLTGLGGKREWAVKGLLNRSAACAGLLAAKPADADPGSAGASYLLEKQRAAQARRELERLLRQFSVHAAAALLTHAAGFRERKAIPNADDCATEMVLNWAFLVSRQDEAQFSSRVAELDAAKRFPGLSFTLSGPWAPYSFAPSLPADQTT